MAVTSDAKGRARPKKRAGRKMKPKKTVKRRSAPAASLADPRYRKRVVAEAPRPIAEARAGTARRRE